MKIAKTFICVGIVSGLLMGCGTNNNGKNLTNRNNVSPVRYNNDGNLTPRDVTYNNDLVDNDNNRTINNNNNNNNNNMRVADDAANRVANLKDVNRANVIVTDSTAYVAVMLNDRSRNELPRTIENKIAKEVRKADNSIDKVYVSVNPDFYDRMNDYATDIRNGHPISGIFDQFTQTIQRIFPNAR
ncbi:YhcN/YlaJ family sporulation lipoprotein [Heyndrickxia sporothermodurans]